MNASQARDFGTMAVRHTPLLPQVEALRRECELRAEDCSQSGNQTAVVVGGVSHNPVYQRSVYTASPQSLIAAQIYLMQCPRMSLSARIIAALKAAGINQAEAARRCGWSAQRFGQYVSGKRTPDLDSLIKIAEVLSTTPDALLGVNESHGSELLDILGRLLELEGLDPQSARTIAEAASATQRVLKSLPGDDGNQDRARLAAQAVWSARQLPKPDTALDQ